MEMPVFARCSALVFLLAVAGCLEVQSHDATGTEFSCAEPPYTCPSGFECVDGRCTSESDRPDAARVPPPDAAMDAPPGTPDAQPTITMSFGERDDTDVQGVTFDTYIRDDQPAANFGANVNISVDATPVQMGLIRFDLSAIPTDATVVSAQLHLNVFDPLENGDFTARALIEEWDASEATWTDRRTGVAWSTAGAGEDSVAAEIIATFAPREAAVEVVPISAAAVQEWVSSPASNHGMRWASTSLDGRGGQYTSCEGEMADRLYLEVTYVAPSQP